MPVLDDVSIGSFLGVPSVDAGLSELDELLELCWAEDDDALLVDVSAAGAHPVARRTTASMAAATHEAPTCFQFV